MFVKGVNVVFVDNFFYIRKVDDSLLYVMCFVYVWIFGYVFFWNLEVFDDKFYIWYFRIRYKNLVCSNLIIKLVKRY